MIDKEEVHSETKVMTAVDHHRLLQVESVDWGVDLPLVEIDNNE